VTPFDEDGEVDEHAHRSNLSTLAGRGVAGFVLAGSTGEGPYLEPGERLRLVSATRDELGPTVPIVCGIAAQTTRMALAQVEEAAGGGADAVLVMTPTLLARGDSAVVVRHFSSVADLSPLPVLLYSVPPVTGYELPIDAIFEAAQHPNVIGMKDSGGDATRVDELVSLIGPEFVFYAGASRAVLDSVSRGATGAITASANYAPGLVAAAASRDQEAQTMLVALTKVVEAEGLPGTKMAANLTGLVAGRPRRPLVPVSPAVRDRIAAALESSGLRAPA
jgi:4-hydroxy-2-oxoglutarate aldolase